MKLYDISLDDFKEIIDRADFILYGKSPKKEKKKLAAEISREFPGADFDLIYKNVDSNCFGNASITLRIWNPDYDDEDPASALWRDVTHSY